MGLRDAAKYTDVRGSKFCHSIYILMYWSLPRYASHERPLTMLKVQAKIRWLVKVKQPRQI
jgi:hypothetical protein